MLKRLKLEHILFLDIETIPAFKDFSELDGMTQVLWESKSEYQRKDKYSAEEFYQKAGIWAEFGKIICISVGYFVIKKDGRQFRIRSFHGEEKSVLKDFKNLLDNHFHKPHHLLCAHNGKEFDFPYIARRMVVHGIHLPEKLNLFGKKPWEIPHLDTMELWKFGDYKNYTSLKLLTHILNIPSPKDDIDGSEVYRVYYEENDLERIVTYCEKDTLAVAQVFLKFRNEDLLHAEEIVLT